MKLAFEAQEIAHCSSLAKSEKEERSSLKLLLLDYRTDRLSGDVHGFLIVLLAKRLDRAIVVIGLKPLIAITRRCIRCPDRDDMKRLWQQMLNGEDRLGRCVASVHEHKKRSIISDLYWGTLDIR